MSQGRAVFLFSLLVSAAPGLVAAPDDHAPVCAKCHPKETAAYLKSPMGGSLVPPSMLAGARITHKASGAEISIIERDGRMIHSLSASGFTAEYPIAYQVGAGKIGHTYIVQIGDYLFESPASWYRQHGWDVSPGYQLMASVDFDRPVEAACIFCHAGNGKFVGSDGRRFSGIALQAIGCDRCHGPAEEHARHPSRDNIINPSRLSRRARESVCEQCHIEGETRLLNPGKTWQDFRAGDEFERTAVTYLLSQGEHNLKAVGQVEQLAQSKCVRVSGGKLWCGSCHSPHAQVASGKGEIRAICESCHATLSKEAHAAVTECTSCHMPRLTPNDIPHAASTDHRILRRPAPLVDAKSTEPEISAWQDPPPQFRERDLAVASLVIGGKRGSAALRAKGVMLLEALPPEVRDSDPAVLSSLVSIKLNQRDPKQAQVLARRAAELQPDSGFASLSLAIALENSGDEQAAVSQYLHTIDLDPSLQAALTNLVFLYDRLSRPSDKAALLDRYLKWNPQSIWLRQLKALTTEAR